MDEDYSEKPSNERAQQDIAVMRKRERLQAFIEKCSKSRDTTKFKFMEGRDCPICLGIFKDDDDVIQLRCHKFHIYHEACLNEMLTFTEVESKCLMCRIPILMHTYDTNS